MNNFFLLFNFDEGQKPFQKLRKPRILRSRQNSDFLSFNYFWAWQQVASKNLISYFCFPEKRTIFLFSKVVFKDAILIYFMGGNINNIHFFYINFRTNDNNFCSKK